MLRVRADEPEEPVMSSEASQSTRVIVEDVVDVVVKLSKHECFQ